MRRRWLCEKVGEECLFLQLQDLSTQSGLSEGEEHDEAPLSQQQLRDAGLPPTESWDGFNALPHHGGGRSQPATPIYPSLVELLLLLPSNSTTSTGINQAGLAQLPPCAAFCDTSSLTRRACSGRAEQPCPPLRVNYRGSGAV